MQLYSQIQNYVTLDTLEFILKEHKDLIVSVCISGKDYRLKLWTKRMEFFLGTTRRLLRIPSKSKYPNLWHFLVHLDGGSWCHLLDIAKRYSRK